MFKTGFPPVIHGTPRLIILGSMPGERSLAEQQYYAHPQNAFWPVLSELLRFDPALPYEARAMLLTKHHIALWDVIAQCRRTGSLDSAIESDTIQPNDFVSLFHEYPTLRHVCFNGQKAAQAFRRYVLPTLDSITPSLEYHTLPSTSPANARMSRTQKCAAWSLLTHLN